MKDIKISKRFVYDGLGFPVVLRNVPMVKVRGSWTPQINYNELSRHVILALATKPGRLTGHEVRFIRHYFGKTLESFGKRFDVSHPAVLKWEDAGEEAIAVKWPMEKDIRLFILDQLNVKPRDFKGAYENLRVETKASHRPIEMDIASAA